MMRPLLHGFFASTCLAMACLAATTTPIHAADGLHTIDDPGGGHIVYGPLATETTLRGAVVSMLRNVHQHFGARPVVGKLIQTPDHASLAVSFTLTAEKADAGRIAGMIIVTQPTTGQPTGSGADTAAPHPAAAVIYDQADRFAHTATALMKALNAAWRHDAATATGGTANPPHAATARELHTIRFPDNSGSIGLADGWHLTQAGGGAVHAAGPDGEAIHLGAIWQGIYDPRNPQTQGMLHYLDMGHHPYYVYPYGGSLVDAWISIARQSHQRDGTPAPSFTTTSTETVPHSPYESAAVLALGVLDAHDGKGPLKARARIGALKPTGAQWALTLELEVLPANRVEQDWPTIVAMVQSYRQNGAEIQRQTNMVIDQIHANAAAANARAQATAAANDAHNRAVEAGWDDAAKYNKSFENYTLDRAVIQDNDTGEHGTGNYGIADALVKANPQRFQYVPTQDLLKGVDY
jgi:hypothetical protein